MKKVLKKSVSVLMIVVMCLTMAPMQGFLGLDIGEWFASVARAAVVTSSTNIGLFQDYDTKIVVVINGSDNYEYVSETTIDGKEYSIKNKNLISIDDAENLKNNMVIFTVEDNVIVSIRRFKANDTKLSLNGKNASVTYENSKFKYKKLTLKGEINNSLNRKDLTEEEVIIDYYNTMGINQLEDISITLRTGNSAVIYFGKDILGCKKTEVTLDLDKLGAGDNKSFEFQVYVDREYCPTENSEEVTVDCILQGTLNGKEVSESTSFKINIDNKDFGKPSTVKKIPLMELLEILQKDITLCRDLSSSEISLLSLDIAGAMGWKKFAQADEMLGAIEVAYDEAGALAGFGLEKTAQAAGEVYLEAIISSISSELQGIDDFANSLLEKLLNSKEFNIYINWYDRQIKARNPALSIYEIACPVDVVITDIDGNIVLTIINNQVVNCDSYVYAYVVDGKKYVYLPTDIDHNIEIIATDDGTMDYSVSMHTPSGLMRTVKYNEVPLVKDESYTALAPCESMLKTEAYNLTSESGEEIEADYDSLPPIEDNVVDVIVAEELFDGFPVEAIDLVADTVFNMKSVVDLSAYDISTDDSVALFSAVAKYYPAEYSLIANSDFTYKIIVSPNLDRIMKIRFYYGDDANLSTYQKRVNDLNAEIDALVAKVEGMNEFEKALYIHDCIVLNSEYDLELLEYMEANNYILPGELRSEKYTEYSILVNGTGVCGSYALAYRAVLNAAGMECLYLSSSQMNHAWNLVKIDGNWYHVDCCWDDPVPDTYGRARRTYFLRTDEEIMDLNHYSWTPGRYKASSDKYSNMSRYYDIQQKYNDGKWYYLRDDKLYSSDVYGNDEEYIGDLFASAIDADDGCIYFADCPYIYEYNLETTEKKLVYMTPKEKMGYNPAKAKIYNFYVDGEDVEVYKTIYNKDDELIKAIDKATLQKSKLASITGIDISATALEIDVLNSSALTASVAATESLDGFDFTFNWSTSNENIVGVDQEGNIFAKNVGTATINASLGTDVDGIFSASCEVTVSGDGTKGVCGDNALWSIDVPTKTLTISGTGALTTYNAVEEWPWHASRNGIENIIIEDGITDITKYAFMDMVNIKEIVIPDSVNYLRNGAFQNCTSLEKVDIGSGLKETVFVRFNPLVFKGCKSLREFIVSPDNTSFAVDEYGALTNKDGSVILKYPAKREGTVYISSDVVTSICENAFEYADKLEEIVLNDGIITILNMTFRDCVNLKHITLPSTLTTIYKTAFYNCKSLESIHLPKSFSTIKSLLSYDGFSAADSIYANLFMGCESLKTIYVENGNEKFYNDKFGALYEIGAEDTGDKLWRLPPASNLKDYVASENVVQVASNAFNGCNNLEKILFEESVTTIGKIENLSNLEKIYILTKGKCSFSSVVFAEEGTVYCYESMLMNSNVPEGRYRLLNESHEHDYFLRDFSEFTDETDGYEYYKCYGCDLDYSTVIHNNGEPVTTEATCTLSGNKSVECKVCGAVTVLETIPATGKHDYQLTSTTPGSCTEAPVYHYSCSVCGGTKDKTGTMDEGHTYIETVIEPTCTEKGYTIATCSECDETVIYDYKSPSGHNLDIKRKDSYCSAHDTIEYSCRVCDYKEVVAPYAELLETTTVTVEPTCTKSGSYTDVCNLCGATVAIEVINPLSHDYSDEFTTDREANCTEAGSKSKHCSRCDATREITEIHATGHQNTSIINKADATCTKNGYTGDIYCDDCESVIEKGESTDLVVHAYGSVVTAPTCTSKGYTTHTCAVCGYTYTSDETAMLEHSYSSVVAPATCTEKGYTTYTCAVCSHSYTGDETPAVGHTYNDKGVCEKCGKSRVDNCSHMCHKSGFISFIWKIVRFFWKLFKMNPVCECGVKHW